KKGWEAALESGLKMSGESGPEKELGWLMIAKYLPRCSEQEKRTLRSRVSSRFTNACHTSCSLPSSLFVRAALAAFPAFRTLYKAQLDAYLDQLLREAQESASSSDSSLLEQATRELWATHATTERLEKAAAELRAIVYEAGKAVEVSGLRAARGRLLLRLVADCVRHADKGSCVPGSLLDTIGAAMEKEAWRADALRLLEAVVRAASWAVACNAKSLCQSLVRMSPSAELYEVLTALEETLGASSHIYAHLAIVFNGLSHPLPSAYADEAVRLLETVIVRSGWLVEPAVLSCVCSAVCSAALRYRTLGQSMMRVYGRLVAAFLSHGNDAVPVPVHIARALISWLAPCEERSRLQLVADAVCRPRTYAMAPSLLVDETARVRKEAAMCRVVKRVEEEMEEKEVEQMEEESPLDDSTAAAAADHEREMVQMRVMEGEEKKGKKEEEEEEEIEDEEDEGKRALGKKEIHIQSRKEKKKAAKKRRLEEKAAASAAKKQKKTNAAGSEQPKKSPKKEEKIKDQEPKKKVEEKKPQTVKSVPVPSPQPITPDLQEVIDMAVLDFD
ncbi:hypothetical protein PMAYCL1PPCAC_22492, partial [Pristionchus mayeri]